MAHVHVQGVQGVYPVAPEKAIPWLERAHAVCAVPEAPYNLGVIYGHGQGGIAVDGKRAFRYYKAAAKTKLGSGSTAAILNIIGPNNDDQVFSLYLIAHLQTTCAPLPSPR